MKILLVNSVSTVVRIVFRKGTVKYVTSIIRSFKYYSNKRKLHEKLSGKESF